MPEFALKGETPPGLRRWYRASLKPTWVIFAAAAVLALVLPAGLAPRGSLMRAYVDLVATVYPYVGFFRLLLAMTLIFSSISHFGR